MMLGLSFCVTSCDKDDNQGPTTESEKLLGTWRSDFETGYQLMTFKDNNYGTFLEFDSAAESYSDSFSWNYIQSTQKLRLIDDEGYVEDYLVLLIANDRMILQYDDHGFLSPGN